MQVALKLTAVAAIAGVASTLLATTFNARPAPSARITGDYVESRTASVFCGECHYNSQMVTYGHEALLAWSFDGGTYRGVNLKGVRAMAAVRCEENLSFHQLPHYTQLVIDTGATSEQAAAVSALIQEKCGSELGDIQVSRAAVSFKHDSSGYVVKSEGFASLDVSYRTDDGCCKMPGLVWYSPLSPVTGSKVGFTEFAGFTGPNAAPWSQSGDDYAFYGAISF